MTEATAILAAALTVAVLTIGGLAAAALAMCWLFGRQTRDLNDRIMATDWPSYVGYQMQNERMIVGTGYRDRERPRPPDRTTAGDDLDLTKEDLPEEVQTF
ncbi:MAG: hypothetical protein PHU85_00585 [Phycisphaerae bacterium]|nr:hypothetical protein [Phycisphaerae bacterium]